MPEPLQISIAPDGKTATIRIPMRVNRVGGRKIVIAPDADHELSPATREPNAALIKALGRAFRWQRLLEIGTYSTIEEIAAAEKVNDSYIGRLLRLSLLAPDIIDAVLDGRGHSLTLLSLSKPFSLDWENQRRMFMGALKTSDGHHIVRVVSGVPAVSKVGTG